MLNRFTKRGVLQDRPGYEQSYFRIQIVQKLLTDPIRQPAPPVLLRKSQGHILTVLFVNQISVTHGFIL